MIRIISVERSRRSNCAAIFQGKIQDDYAAVLHDGRKLRISQRRYERAILGLMARTAIAQYAASKGIPVAEARLEIEAISIPGRPDIVVLDVEIPSPKEIESRLKTGMDPIADLRKAVDPDRYCPKCMTCRLTEAHVCLDRRIVIGEAMAHSMWAAHLGHGKPFDRAEFERLTSTRVIS